MFLVIFSTSWTVERDLLFVFGENGRKFVSYTWRREWMVTNCIVVFIYRMYRSFVRRMLLLL